MGVLKAVGSGNLTIPDGTHTFMSIHVWYIHIDLFGLKNDLTLWALYYGHFAVERILNAKNVTSASPMAPACGLYLGEVKYDLPTT